MKYILALLLFTGLSLRVDAQKLTISDELPMRSDLSYEILGEIKGKVLIFNRESSRYSIQALDENMRASWEKEIELDRKNASIIGLNVLGEQFTLFYYYREKGSTFVKAARYDASANMQDSVTLTDLGFLLISPSFSLTISEDHTKVLLHYLDRDNIFRVTAFDNAIMAVLWQKSFQDEDYSESEDMLHMLVDNAGQMFAVMEKDQFHLRRERHRYDVFRFGSYQNWEVTRFSIPMKGLMTYDVRFTYDNVNQKLTAGGFYYEKNPERAEGYFVIYVPAADPGKSIFQHFPFENDFIDRLNGKEVRNRRGVEQVVVKDLILRKDGGLLIVGEESKNLARRMTNVNRSIMLDNMTRSVIDYYYEDIFILALHPDGKLHWSTILHKKQYSQDDDGAFSSYFLFKTPAYLRLVFNDEIKFENTVSEYLLRINGDFDRNSILSTETLQLRLRFRDAVQVSAGRMLVPSERRGKLRIARIDLL